MNYEIEKNTDKIIFFRESITVNMFNNLEDKTASKELTLEQLPEYFTEKNINKTDRRLFQINPFLFGKKTRHYSLLPHSIIIDIDADIKKNTKEEVERRQNLLNDLNVDTIEQAINKLFDIFKNDECCLLCAKTQSNAGIKAVFNVITKEFTTNGNYSYSDDNGTLSKQLMDNNFDIVKDYLKKYNLKQYKNSKGKEIGYLDPSASNITQGFFSSPFELHINKDAYVLKDMRNSTFNNIVDEYDHTGNRVNTNQLIMSNDEFAKKLINYIKKIEQQSKTSELSDKKIKELFKEIDIDNDDEVKSLNNMIKKENKRIYSKYILAKTEKERIRKELAPYFQHMTSGRGLELRFSLKFLSKKYRKFFYKLFELYYVGSKRHLFLSSFEQFNNNLESLNGASANFLFNIFRPIFSTNPLNNHKKDGDFLNFKYNSVYNYNNYISERKDDLFKIFNENNTTVLKAQAGGGKTTVIQDYFFEQLKNNINTAVFVIPKNSLLDQQYEIISEKLVKFNEENNINIKLVKNYGDDVYKYYNFGYDEKILVLSSTRKLENCKDADLIVVDEIHNLVLYSGTILSNVHYDCKKILISATPEIYLIGVDTNSYHYVNMVKNNVEKKEITLINNTQHMPILKKLISKDRKQLVFMNNFDAGKKIVDEFSDVNFVMLNSNEKRKENVKEVIKHQKLFDTHYIATSFISDGINFLNSEIDKKFDDIIIIENSTLTNFEIYQLSNRFRHLPDINIILLCKNRKEKYNREYDLSFFHDHVSFNKKKEILLKNQEDLQEIVGGGSNLLNSRHFLNINGEFVLNDDTLKQVVYERLNNDYFKYKDIFLSALSYYFKLNFVYFKVDAENIDNSEKEEDMIKSFLDNFDDILTILDNVSDRLDNDNYEQLLEKENKLNRFDKKIVSLLINNENFIKRVMGRIELMREITINIDENKDKLILAENQFVRWKNNKSRKILGESMDGSGMDAFSKDVWESQNRLYKIINNSNILQYDKKGNKFFTVDDMVDYFNINGNIYETMVDKDNEPLFSLNHKSIGSFLSNIERHYKKCRKKVDGKDKRGYLFLDIKQVKEDNEINIHNF